MRLLTMVAALTLAVSAPVAGAPSLASSGCPLFPADNADFGSGTWEGGPIEGGPDAGGARPTPADPSTTAQDPGPAAEADPGRGSERAGLVPQVLTVLLGLTAAALAARVIRRTRPTTPGR